jgi:hypothetical protein
MRFLATLLALAFVFLVAPAHAQDEYRVVLRFTTVTGGDDLRGGGDNVYAVYNLAGTETRRVLNQRGMRWADRSRHVTDIPLPASFRIQDLRSLRLETNFRGGIDGDNWDMASVVVQVAAHGHPGAPLTIARGGPQRFTGDRRTLNLTIQPELPPAGGISK